ncbi:MAG: NAD(P)/FAD-dependent oxidoreductase [Clostridium sp.]|nr:NAD(P)/FAD-dependent oxidoreductase [Clostridium sp.]
MENLSDLIIIGAGPAGLMTAKQAAKLGLKVTIVELKKDISKVKRACSAQFVTDEGYENETVKIENNKIVFTKNGFDVNYTGPTLNIIDNYHHSPGGHKLHFAHKDHRPFAIKFDKGHLLSDLWKDCEKSGVNLMLETIAYNGEDLGDHVRVDIKKGKNKSSLFAKKLVIAEGANAKLTGKFGLNKGRTYYGTPFVFSCVMEGTTGFAPQSWNQFYGSKYHPFAEVIIESTLEGNDAVELTITGTKDLKPKDLFNKFINENPMKHHFTNARIIEERGCSLKSFDSLKRPYSGNVLVIGDSAAHIEVIVQGALMCGYHAALAINDELQGKNGFEKYTKWWDEAFDFNRSDPLEFVKLYGSLGMMPKYSDEELDYLFSLVENQTIKGNFGQFEVPKNVWKTILVHKDQIQKDRPELFNKIKGIIELQDAGKLD